MSDFNVAVRSLVKTPAFSIVAILTIAVGIGANTALFSVYDRLVLHPVSIPDPSSLVAIWTNNPRLNFNAPAVAWPRYEDIRSESRSFSSLGISAFDNFTLTGNGEPEQLNGQRIDAAFLPTLGMMPALGRNFTPDEDMPNGPTVCIISHELWTDSLRQPRRRSSAETITLNGQSWQVVGVMPPRLTPPFSQVQVFAPRVFEIGGLTAAQIQAGAGYAQPIAGLKSRRLARAGERAELRAISRGYQGAVPDPSRRDQHERAASVRGRARRQPAARFLHAARRGRLRAADRVRQRRVAVSWPTDGAAQGNRRAAVAWRHPRPDRPSVRDRKPRLLGGGGQRGVLLVLWAMAGIQSLVATALPPNTVLTLDGRALAFTLAITVDHRAPGRDPAGDAGVPRQRGRRPQGRARADRPSERGNMLRSGLIVAEVALSIVLLVGSESAAPQFS